MNPSIYIPLVNDKDEIIGHGEKLDVHIKGQLHRAFSILIFDSNRKLLLHQRAWGKYHSPGLWTNTCCGHPNEGESMDAAIHRRLQEEMGFDCELEFKFKFRYKAEFPNGLTEHEIDHVYVGVFEGEFVPNKEEVADTAWVNASEIIQEVSITPEKYTYWFREILENKAYVEILKGF
ncbi:MAG: isopentenyl-diphosphate Delta-isomerase [Leadbetterella sp.]